MTLWALPRDLPAPALGIRPADPRGEIWVAEWLAASGTLPEAIRQTVAALIHLAAGNWETAHTLTQGIDTPEAEYVHAILHRQEGDAFNAHYWYRRVTKHPVSVAMKREPGYTTLQAFVAMAVHPQDAIQKAAALRLHEREWHLLYEHLTQT